MFVSKAFNYTGAQQKFTTPANVVSLKWEVWGAAGGMASYAYRATLLNKLIGGFAPINHSFSNNPNSAGQLGYSFPNGGGYVSGHITTTSGNVYYIYVGGNGGPGKAAIKNISHGAGYQMQHVGGAGGYNGGGQGGQGHYMLDDSQNWVGSAGGGGGGATDIRTGGTALSNRILVAGGGGGSGVPKRIASGAGAWGLVLVPSTASNPPFGPDTTGSGASGTDGGTEHLWATDVQYFAQGTATAGWGLGGSGGGANQAPGHAPVIGGGVGSTGMHGGAATKSHSRAVAPTSADLNGGGGGGTETAGGKAGVTAGQSTYSGAPAGYTAATAGALGVGGNGADGAGVSSEYWGCGGGGGGGGFYGGGGGGQGYWDVTGHGHWAAGGGGGGSNYASSSFTRVALCGVARPPANAPSNSHGPGTKGLGGYARVSYNILPTVKFTASTPSAVDATQDFTVSFTTTIGNNADQTGFDHYIIGTGPASGSSPTSQTTIVPTTKELTNSYTFNAGTVTAGATIGIFVQVVDTWGDASSGWVKKVITGYSPATVGVAITTPAANAHLPLGDVTMDWTVGDPHPVGFFPAVTSLGNVGSTWVAGGSRVNLFNDPGQTGALDWQSGASLPVTSTAVPGVSGHCSAMAWGMHADQSQVIQSQTFPLLVGVPYHVSLKVASTAANDTRNLLLYAIDDSGVSKSYTIDLSGTAANTLLQVDIVVTPHDTNTYFQIVPVGSDGNAGDTDAAWTTYIADALLDLFTGTYAAYFDGWNLNGMSSGTVSWSGVTNNSPSIYAASSDLTTTVCPYQGPAVNDTTLYLLSLSTADLIDGRQPQQATQTISLNGEYPQMPTVTLTVDNPNARMQIDINAADSGAPDQGGVTAYFDIYRNGVRIATGVVPDPTTRLATYYDIPANGESATYIIRAWANAGGYLDQPNGRVVIFPA